MAYYRILVNAADGTKLFRTSRLLGAGATQDALNLLSLGAKAYHEMDPENANLMSGRIEVLFVDDEGQGKILDDAELADLESEAVGQELFQAPAPSAGEPGEPNAQG